MKLSDVVIEFNRWRETLLLSLLKSAADSRPLCDDAHLFTHYTLEKIHLRTQHEAFPEAFSCEVMSHCFPLRRAFHIFLCQLQFSLFSLDDVIEASTEDERNLIDFLVDKRLLAVLLPSSPNKSEAQDTFSFFPFCS